MSTENHHSVLKVFEEIMKEHGFTKDIELARFLDVSKQTVYNWRERGTISDYSRFTKKGYSELWVRTGKLPIHTPFPHGTEKFRQFASAVLEQHDQDRYKPGNKEHIKIPRYEVSASAGGGSLISSEQLVDYLAFNPEWLANAKGITPGNLALITVIGDSMVPTIQDGDLILIDTTLGRFKSDAIYVIQQGDRLWVKRVQYRLDGTIIIKSDNAANYSEEIFSNDQLDGLRIIGRVVWRGGNL